MHESGHRESVFQSINIMQLVTPHIKSV